MPPILAPAEAAEILAPKKAPGAAAPRRPSGAGGWRVLGTWWVLAAAFVVLTTANHR